MRQLLMLGLIFNAIFSGFAFAVDSSQEKFQREFFEPHILRRPALDDERLRSVDAARQKDLLGARATVIAFFAATQDLSGDPRRFLGSPLIDRFRSRTELYAAVSWLGTATYILSMRGFRLLEPDVVELTYYVVFALEGTMTLREDQVKLQRIGNNWKIVSIGGLE